MQTKIGDFRIINKISKIKISDDLLFIESDSIMTGTNDEEDFLSVYQVISAFIVNVFNDRVKEAYTKLLIYFINENNEIYEDLAENGFLFSLKEYMKNIYDGDSKYPDKSTDEIIKELYFKANRWNTLKIYKIPFQSWVNMRWTEEEINFLKENYYSVSNAEISEKLNKSVLQIYRKAYEHNLKKDKIFQQIQGHKIGKLSKTKFRKGHVPANKGIKASEKVLEVLRPTMFKKGHIPANTKYDYYISLRHHRRDGLYLVIRVLGKWQYLHRYIWEKINWPIPKGFNVIFADKNKTNFRPENLKLVINAELMKINSTYKYPPELQKLIRINNKLKKEIYQQLKTINND